MAEATSFNVAPAKSGAVRHNRRETTYDYIFKDHTHLNQYWAIPGLESVASERAKVAAIYKQNFGQKMQDKARPIHEGVLVINEDTTMEQVQAFAAEMQRRFGVMPLQIAIHKDEGYEEKDFDENQPEKERRYNLHAHILFRWCDEKGRTFKWSRADGREFQDIAARCLKMNRGKESKKKHLSPQEYKLQMDVERLKRQKALEELSVEELQSKKKEMQKSLKAQTTQLANIEQDLSEKRQELAILDEKIDKDKEENHALLEQRAELLDDIEKKEKERIRKAAMVQEKDLEYNDLKQILSVKSGYTPLDKINVPIPQIDTPPMFNKDKWAEEQNKMIRQTFREGYQKIINQLSEDAQKHVNRAQAQAAMRIEEHIKSHWEEDMKLRTTILRQNYQLQAERQPDKTLLTDVNLWAIRGDLHRMSGRYCSIPFTLSLTSEMERALDYGLSNFEIAAAFLPEIFATCYDVDPDLAEQPEVRDSIVTVFLKLVDSATTPTESMEGGGSSQDGWRDKDKEEDLRKKIFDVACSRISRRGGFRR